MKCDVCAPVKEDIAKRCVEKQPQATRNAQDSTLLLEADIKVRAEYDPAPGPACYSVGGFSGTQAVSPDLQNIHVQHGHIPGGQSHLSSDNTGFDRVLPTQHGAEQKGRDSSPPFLGSVEQSTSLLDDKSGAGVHQAGVQGPSGANVPLVSEWRASSDIPHREKLLSAIVSFMQQRKPNSQPEGWSKQVPRMVSEQKMLCIGMPVLLMSTAI